MPVWSAELSVNDRTLFLLEADLAKNALVDRAGRTAPVVSGGAIVPDETFGACLKLDGEDTAGIAVKDDGSMQFAGGVTLEALVWFDEPLLAKGATLAMKVGSFAWEIRNTKLNTSWLNFPSEPIATTAPEQFKYYPVGVEMINGWMNVPTGKWVRLTASYDEKLGVITTLIDGVVDRRRYRYRGPQPLQSDGKSPVTLLRGFRNCRVGAIQLSRGAPEVVPPSMEAYLNALPYRSQVLLTLDHIDPRLALPIEVGIVWEKASGEAATLQKLTLDSHARREVVLDAMTWLNSLHTYTVVATSGGRQVFSRTLRAANVKPAGRTTINVDRTISRDGQKFFPLMIYHAMPEDFSLMAELGFNVVFNDFNLYRTYGADRAGYVRGLTECLDAAEKNRLFMIATANSTFGKLFTIPAAKDHPALLMWYGADEPWGDLTRLSESYNTIKILEPDLPVLIVQNNLSRLQDTAPGADIVATDPYPVPNVSLRGVVDATQTALRATGGRKPTWTVLPQYGAKIPTRVELRSMTWLAIASGATGLGYFAWDERAKDPATKELKGWFTKDHPEQIEDLRAVLQEVRALESVVLTPDAAAQPGLRPENRAIHVLLKETAGHRYLIAANDSRGAEETVIRIEGAPVTKVRRLDRGTEGIVWQAGDGGWVLKMPPLSAGVFEMSP